MVERGGMKGQFDQSHQSRGWWTSRREENNRFELQSVVFAPFASRPS